MVTFYIYLCVFLYSTRLFLPTTYFLYLFFFLPTCPRCSSRQSYNLSFPCVTFFIVFPSTIIHTILNIYLFYQCLFILLPSYILLCIALLVDFVRFLHTLYFTQFPLFFFFFSFFLTCPRCSSRQFPNSPWYLLFTHTSYNFPYNINNPLIFCQLFTLYI